MVEDQQHFPQLHTITHITPVTLSEKSKIEVYNKSPQREREKEKKGYTQTMSSKETSFHDKERKRDEEK